MGRKMSYTLGLETLQDPDVKHDDQNLGNVSLRVLNRSTTHIPDESSAWFVWSVVSTRLTVCQCISQQSFK